VEKTISRPHVVTWKRLFRRLANKVLDALFIVKSPAGLQRTAVILHGDSCSGKSTILRQLRRRYTGCTYMEMDSLQYWKIDADPDILNVALNLLAEAGVEKDKAKALVRTIEEFGRQPGMTHSPHHVMVEMLKTCLANDAVIATCGNLPPPHGEFGYYQLLAQCSGKAISHVLIAPDKEEYAKRVRSRSVVARADSLLKNYGWRMQNRASYDLVVTGNESMARMQELIRATIK
jgi:chloramphenicol 3-O-phosphotransferase